MGTFTRESTHGIPQFDGGPGFQNWSYRVKMFLDSAGVLKTLTENPPEVAADKAKFDEADRKAKAHIVSFLANEVLEVVREKNSAKDMWKALENTFAKKSIGTQNLLRKQLNRLKLEEGKSMRAHLLTFEDLIRQLKTAGAKIDEADAVVSLFQTLPDSYDPLVTALENLAEEDLTLEMVKQRLLAEEMKQTERQEDSGTCSGRTNKAAFSGEKSTKPKNVPKKFQGRCHQCGKRGHFKRDCKQNRDNEANVATKNAVVFMADRSSKKASEDKVVFKLDSGASDHLVNRQDVLSTFKKLRQSIIINVAKDGETLQAKISGTITGCSNRETPLRMEDVLLVPELRDNLMSVKKLATAGVDVIFSGPVAVLKKGGQVIATAQMKGGLYEMEIKIEKPVAGMCALNPNTLWHRRLGHLSQHGMDEMVKNDLVNGIDCKPDKLSFCDVCVQAKQCRDPFNGTRDRATRPLERIHSDLCGPVDPPAWDGSRYILTFIDDHTHFAMIYLLKRKNEVFTKFREYEAMVSNMFGMKISKLRIDQGREYLSNAQKQYYARNGIQVETTVACTPQQNGVAERFNRTLVEKIRAMLFDSKVPRSMWSEAALTAVYLINRSPTSALPKSVTPAECWYKQKPSVEKLRVFGCKAFAWIPSQQRRKLDPKGRETIMIGYAANGYRLWDKTARRIVIARDVKFDESCYPYDVCSEESYAPLVVLPRDEQEGESSQVPDQETEQDTENSESDDSEMSEDEDEGQIKASDEHEPAGSTPGALPSQPEQHEPERDAVLRRSDRERKLPGKLLNFFTGYRAISAGSLFTDPPECYADILSRDDREHWLHAVQDELKSMEANGVWKIVTCPSGVRCLKSKWVFRTKEDENGQPVKCKARLVAKGYLQRPGIDFEETYAPVAKLPTIRTILAIGVHQNFHFHQMDVKTAFLHGDLKEDIFMEIPDGVNAGKGQVCKLLKSLYGLKQSPRCWNEKFNRELIKIGLTRSKHDYCLYSRCDDGDEIYIILYVDDLLIAGRRLESVMKLKKQLSTIFDMTDCGEARYFLGMKLDYDRQSGVLKLSQKAQVDKILLRFGMSDCNATKTPMEKGLQLNCIGQPTQEPYRQLLGSLMYLMLCVRPDICFSIGYMGRYQQTPTEEHWNCLKRIIRYLKGTSDLCLEFKKNCSTIPLEGFADSDWAYDTEDRKSVSGYTFKVFGSTVSWSSKKQTTVAVSSSEAEYIALSGATAEALWLSGLLEDLQITRPGMPVVIHEDNRGCIGMATNLETKRSKHIDVKHHFIRDNVASGRIKIEPIETENQVADIFTKSLDFARFKILRKKLGLSD